MRRVAILESDWVEPAAVLRGTAETPYAAGLVSDGAGPRGRWSYIACDPVAVLELPPRDPQDPIVAMRELLGPRLEVDPLGPPFQGGLIGLASYELGARLEPVALDRMAGWPDLACGLYASLLAFDHESGRTLAIGRGDTDDTARDRAQAALAWISDAAAPAQGPLTDGLTSEPALAYEAAVADVVSRIEAGEIFQANVARAWRGRLRPGRRPIDLLDRLLAGSPAPFAAYLRLPGGAIVSNSPERFLRVHPQEGGLWAESRPIKGTRPRGATPEEDRALALALSASDKDRAENLMIVDLMRNDLSRVCEGVETRELFGVETYANVHHLVSAVTGRVRQGLGGLDVLRAAFPPGSITGAPKVQAMKVISGLEAPRGPYCGSLFWAGFDGALDSSVLIRTAVFDSDADGWRVEARAGAGIVADSQPSEEARETEAKIAAIARALTEAS